MFPNHEQDVHDWLEELGHFLNVVGGGELVEVRPATKEIAAEARPTIPCARTLMMKAEKPAPHEKRPLAPPKHEHACINPGANALEWS